MALSRTLGLAHLAIWHAVGVPFAACVVLSDQEGRVLLVRENYGARRWGFPGGRVDLGEEPDSAAVREAREEAGIDVVIIGELGKLDWLDGGNHWTASIFEGSIASGLPAIQDEDEIAAIGWFPVKELPSPLTRTATAWAAGTFKG